MLPPHTFQPSLPKHYARITNFMSSRKHNPDKKKKNVCNKTHTIAVIKNNIIYMERKSYCLEMQSLIPGLVWNCSAIA